MGLLTVALAFMHLKVFGCVNAILLMTAPQKRPLFKTLFFA